MNFFTQILQNHVLMVALVGWLSAQVIKIIIELIRHRKLKLQLLMATGGMPSSHSSLVMSMATAVGLKYGFNSTFFAMAIVAAFVVMYDAQGVRRQAGTHAHIINVILENIENTGIKLDKNLKELLGHTPLQVIAGAILGIIVAVVMN